MLLSRANGRANITVDLNVVRMSAKVKIAPSRSDHQSIRAQLIAYLIKEPEQWVIVGIHMRLFYARTPCKPMGD